MSSEQVNELRQHSLDGLQLPTHDCSLASPTRFNSLVKNLRQKLHDDVGSPDHVDEAESILQQTMDDMACLSRLLRISEACLVDERASSQAAQKTIQDLQHQLQLVSNGSISLRDAASKLKLELEDSQKRHNELELDVNTLRDALCKSESYRKEYAKSKKSELLDMQAKLDAAAAEASVQDAAHQRTRALLLSEVETRAAGANAMQRLEANHAELLVQHQKMQELCNSQDKQLQVSFSLRSSIHRIRAVPPPPNSGGCSPQSFASAHVLDRMLQQMCKAIVTNKRCCNSNFISLQMPRHSRQLQ